MTYADDLVILAFADASAYNAAVISSIAELGSVAHSGGANRLGPRRAREIGIAVTVMCAPKARVASGGRFQPG